MKRIAIIVTVFTVVAATSLLLLASSASAVPSFSRKFGAECSMCHTMWGALNGAGVTFRLSGYRATNGKDLEPVEKNVELPPSNVVIPSSFPLSIITGVGYDAVKTKREAADGTTTTRTGTSLALEDASIFLTGPLGEHLSAFAEFPMFETRNGEFLPTGPAEANDKKTGAIQFSSEKPTFEVAKFWWNNLLGEMAPRDSVNMATGVIEGAQYLYVVYMPYDFMYIYKIPNTAKAPASFPKRALVLQQILTFFGQAPTSPATGIDETPGLAFSAKNFPNPFNPSTKIEYTLTRPGQVSVKIYNVRGELVRTLLDQKVESASGSVTWLGDDDRGQKVASGVYFYQVKSAGNELFNKMTLVK